MKTKEMIKKESEEHPTLSKETIKQIVNEHQSKDTNKSVTIQEQTSKAIKLKDVKTLILGIQGSGKTEFAKTIIPLQFKNPYWYLVNLDDNKNMSPKMKILLAQRKSFQELDLYIGQLISLCQIKHPDKPDCIVIDEADLVIPKTTERLQQYRNMHDLFVNHRHYGIAVIFMTRRPQDLLPLVCESTELKFIFACDNSDNIDRKLKSIDRRLVDMKRLLRKDKHNYIYLRLGETPILCKAIKLKENKQ